MAELSSITKHFKKGVPHHTVVKLADGDNISEYTIPAEDRFKVFNKERFVFFEDRCIPLPEECEELAFIGIRGSSIVFRSGPSWEDQKMVSISPASPQPIVRIETFDHRLAYYAGHCEHPVIRKLLEVNGATEIHIFTNSSEERANEEAVMFAVGHDDKITQIKFRVFCDWGGIDRLIRSDDLPKRGLVRTHTVFSISEREAFLLGRADDESINPIICGPKDVAAPGELFWQSI
ncbi:hypothetical protein IKF03_03065 [Candidatus Saccharibacteria bacterium]|nr:hypothetical protein [Candidatus Saccharibacteria bacterium]